MSPPDLRAWAKDLPPYPGQITVTEHEGVAELRIDDLPTKNALHPHMMVAFADLTAELCQRCRVVILGGAGGSFCSGGNLDSLRSHLARPELGGALVRFMTAATAQLTEGDAMVFGVAEGAAMGGGAELLTACDEVFATPTAKIGFVQARLGVSPGFGGGQRLVARVGPRRALRLLTEARIVSAEEARALGLVDEVVPDPWERARERASEILRLPPEAVRAARRLVRAAGGPAGSVVEQEAFERLWGGPAHLAALSRAELARGKR